MGFFTEMDAPKSGMHVQKTAEFERIMALPRRTAMPETDFVQAVTEWLALPGGQMQLRPLQAMALQEFHDYGGAFCPIAAGYGKALITFLAGTVVDAKRVLLLIPANLRAQTRFEIDRMSKHWRVFHHIRVMSYSELSLEKNVAAIEAFAPDVLVFDECHNLASPKAARTKRVRRYLEAHKDVKILALSGTITRKSLRDYAHLVQWCLRANTPVPRTYKDLEEWSLALDQGVSEHQRIAPGALLDLCTTKEKREYVMQGDIDAVRSAFRRRFIETPGVVATTQGAIDTPIVIRERQTTIPADVKDALYQLRKNYLLPSGDECESGVSAWSHARELGIGFAYHWSPPPPRPWMDARRAWHGYVRRIMTNPPRGVILDSPLMVVNALRRGTLGNVPEHDAWAAIGDSFNPNPVPFWVNDWLVREAEEWALDTGGVVWVDKTAMGAAFKRIPFFGAGSDKQLLAHKKGPAVLSIQAHGTGKNLTQWSNVLVLTPPSSGKTFEQLLARHHRFGQDAEQVEVEVMLHTREMYEALNTAIADSGYIESTTGNAQKLRYATIVTRTQAEFDDLIASGDIAWQKNS